MTQIQGVVSQLLSDPVHLSPLAVRDMLDKSPWLLLQDPVKLRSSFEFLCELVGLSPGQVRALTQPQRLLGACIWLPQR